MAEAAAEIPTRMRAVVYSAYTSDPGDLVVEEVDVPEPGEGFVLVRVRAASINPFDYKIMGGYVRSMMEVTFPKTPGYDVAGTIAKVGPGVSGYAVGDAVMGLVNPFQQIGSFAEYTLLEVDQMARKPENLSFVVAGSCGCVCGTSYQVLTMYSTITAGETNVLILGGSSATGMMGIQFAKQLGAAFIATTSTQEEMCKALGADVVVNYREADYTEVLADKKFDIVYDCVGTAGEYVRVQALTKPTSVFRSIVNGPPEEAKDSELDYQFCLLDFKKSLEDYVPMLEQGTIRQTIDPRSPYALSAEGVQSLFRDSMAGRARGKLVMEM